MPEIQLQSLAQKTGTSTNVGPPAQAQAQIINPTSVQAPIQAQGTFAVFAERPTSRVLANPTTTVIHPLCSIAFLFGSASERSSPRGVGRKEDMNVADDTISGVPATESSSLSRQEQKRLPWAPGSER